MTSAGELTICPTPIGNLGDMTQRAREALQSADVVFAEDTRVTGKLLAALGIGGVPLQRLDENVMQERAPQVVARVLAGERVVYCSDAGMPGVSDPGRHLVRVARGEGARVQVLPGPTAVMTAFVASGCITDTFYVGGFMPRKAGERDALLGSLRTLRAALVFLESPRRLVPTLQSVATAFPFRQVTVCRELTKLHEEVFTAPAPQVLDEFRNRESVKGEVVIVIDGPAPEERAEDDHQRAHRAKELASALLGEGLGPKQVASRLSQDLGVPRNEAYRIALSQADATPC